VLVKLVEVVVVKTKRADCSHFFVKNQVFASACCLLCLDMFSVRLSVFTVEGSSWSDSKAHL
jgi:hypothetical protein